MCATNLAKDQSLDHAKRIAEFSMEAMAVSAQTLIDTEQPSLGYVQIRCGFRKFASCILLQSSPSLTLFQTLGQLSLR